MELRERARQARDAALRLAAADGATRDGALRAAAEALRAAAGDIAAANEEDLRRGAEEGLAAPLLKRLRFDASGLETALEGLRSLAGLPDPLGATLAATELDRGLELYKVSCPIGVIGVIFESRPDALVQISSLCLKSGNAVLLKGGHEALRTNRVLTDIIRRATVEAGAPDGWIHLLETRDEVGEMLQLDDLIDLVIPRGSNQFVRYIMDHSNIPVLGHADGICHLYLDAAADADMAVELAVDAKCQYPAVCNACETLLVHEAVSGLLPRLAEAFRQRGTVLRGCPRTRALVDCEPASEEDWSAEYLDAILAVKVVASLDEAVAHINTYGSGHTDAIVTSDRETARAFMSRVDSGNVFWNCSTRFSDGFRYGLGAEVGISTQKIHARGPVGLDGLLSTKWKLLGSGQAVAPYADGRRVFTHQPLQRACPL